MTGRFEMVSVDKLVTNHTAGTQRVEGIQEARAAKIAAEWNLAMVGTITVSRRLDGTLFVMDGAHRTCAARERGVAELPALVYDGLTRAQEAAMFAGLNDFKQPSYISRFLARVDSGDPQAVEIKGILDRRGWRIDVAPTPGTVAALAAIESIYKDGVGTLPRGRHPELVEWVFDIITSAWDYDRNGAHRDIIRGLAQIKGRFGDAVDGKTLVNRLSQVQPLVILGKAKSRQDFAGGTVPAAVATVVVGLYNNRLRKNLLPEWVWTR